MALGTLTPIYVPVALQELSQPKVIVISTGADLTSCTATLKVRTTDASGSAIVTLTSPTDITLGGTAGTLTVTFTSAHFTALLAGLSTNQNRGVYDLLVTPSAGAPQVAAAGPVILARTISR